MLCIPFLAGVIASGCSSHKPAAVENGPELQWVGISRDQAIEIAKQEFVRRLGEGFSFEVKPETVIKHGYGWTVVIELLPESPDRYFIFKISREGKILGWSHH